MKREPSLTIGAITAAVTAILGLLVAFGLPLSNAQEAAILAVIGPVAVLVGALVIRSKVTPSADPRDVAGNPLSTAGPVD